MKVLFLYKFIPFWATGGFSVTEHRDDWATRRQAVIEPKTETSNAVGND